MDEADRALAGIILALFLTIATVYFVGWCDSIGVTFEDACGVYTILLVLAGSYHYLDWVFSVEWESPLDPRL
jgi:hypothetical protein